jgi:hypothetical protein
MTIIASCGHEIKNYDEGRMCGLREFNRSGDHVVCFRFVCAKCFNTYAEEGMLITNIEEEQEWINRNDNP